MTPCRKGKLRMEPIGAAHGLILNDVELRQGLIRDSRFRRPPPSRKRNLRIRRRVALALHGLAPRFDPAVRVPELVDSDSKRKPMNCGWLP